jgi:hypothetical protein
MLELTQQEADTRTEIGTINNMTIRFFGEAIVDGCIDTVELTEQEFEEQEGVIDYQRHTVFANGVSQICLTKTAHY